MRYYFFASINPAVTVTNPVAQTTCGYRGFLKERAQSAALLEKQVYHTGHDHLRGFLFVGDAWATNCFDRDNLTEAEAGRLVEYHFDFTQSWWRALQKTTLRIVALAELGVSFKSRHRSKL